MTTSAATSRFETYSYTKEQLLLIMDDKNSKNTKKANEAAVRLFERFLVEKGWRSETASATLQAQPIDWISLSRQELCLAEILWDLFISMRLSIFYLYMCIYNIATVGWQLVHYAVYGTKKSDNGLGFASSIIAFLRPVNCIVDSPPSNICIMIESLESIKKSIGLIL